MFKQIISAAVQAGKKEARKRANKLVDNARRDALNGARGVIGLPPVESPKKGKKK